MTGSFKTFLLWLLIAVVPFQATAAGLRACASGHLGRSVSVVSAAGERTVQPRSLHVVKAKQTGFQGHCPEAAKLKVSKVDTPDSSKHGSCSSCAACSVGVFAPPPVLNFPPTFKNPEVFETFGISLVASFIPDSLKRPPRRFHS